VNLIRRNSVLAVNQHPKGREPLLQRDGGILEDRELFDGELISAGAALPALCGLEVIGIVGILAKAVGATWAIWPAHSGYRVNADLFVAKVLNRLL
jgi:hypothetical protein